MVIISSFYNEEYLLPWWLEHHKDMFEHGVLFDYFSTDRSVEIIKSICPTWEVRKTRNKDWDFQDNDNEFMDAEREFSGYKTVLTTTEFIVGQMPRLPDRETVISMPIIRMVDKEPDSTPSYDQPLVDQKNFGVVDRTTKRRFLHNYPDGKYGVGRHNSGRRSYDTTLKIFKYVYSPWNEEFINRKLSMRDYVNPENIANKWGTHHIWNRDMLEEKYNQALKSPYAVKYSYTRPERNVLG